VHFVVKPAIGGGGGGVERLCEGEASTAVGSAVGAAPHGEVLLQPFLGHVRRMGELSFVFINGALLHTARALSARATTHRPYTCRRGRVRASRTAARFDTQRRLPTCLQVRKEPHGWDSASGSQPVTRLEPPPAAAERTARRALEVARICCGVESPRQFYLARVDLLPAAPAPTPPSGQGGGGGEAAAEDVAPEPLEPDWLVSELELGWPHLFLRAAAAADATATVAAGLLCHLTEDVDLAAADLKAEADTKADAPEAGAVEAAAAGPDAASDAAASEAAAEAETRGAVEALSEHGRTSKRQRKKSATAF
jgi:hypothetical protein